MADMNSIDQMMNKKTNNVLFFSTFGVTLILAGPHLINCSMYIKNLRGTSTLIFALVFGVCGVASLFGLISSYKSLISEKSYGFVFFCPPIFIILTTILSKYFSSSFCFK